MGTLRRIALFLVLVGALNWGLIGFFDFDLVAAIFGGDDTLLARIVYSLVGISALFCIPLLFVPDRDEYDRREHVRAPDYATEFSEETDPDDFRLD